MKQRKLIWQIFPANLLILILTVVSVTWFGKSSLQSFYLQELEKGLVARAHLIEPVVASMLKADDINQFREYIKNSGRKATTRITVILSDGKVIADSNENPDSMELHHNRVEIKRALKGEVGTSVRFSRTLGQEMLYVAVPINSELEKDSVFPAKGSVVAVLRMSVTVDAIQFALKNITSRIIFGVIGFGLLAAVASLLVSRNISKPLEEIKRAAERFSKGDFTDKMTVYQNSSASTEVAALATAMDKMATQLDERIETIKSQRNELETVFSSMVEAVIAVDSNERVININSAAAKLFGIEKSTAKGKLIQAVFRNINLQQQIKEVIKSGISIEDETLHVDMDGQKFLQTNIVSLNDRRQNVQGVLVVLNDVTRLRKLESMRRDFVANVSHELRTPITSIRGYVETLLDGAIDNRDDALKFLDTVLRQSERLSEIIEDLMVLSRIEQEADHGLIKRAKGSLCVVLDVAIETCEHTAKEKNISIFLECPQGIELDINETLIEQALVNLLVNAIKYSKEGSEVRVVAEKLVENGKNVVKIHVMDDGIGIASNHLPRLFERFYRSDKARSRAEGGTGLGLAIVKHIVLAHNGQVDVTSELGKGSTFTMTLPIES
jgi:two-component system phosphate regulon sensor histidine kinase PhoR